MKLADDVDIWPGWPAAWNINGLKAPYGEQTDWDYSSDKYAFNAYLICGNQNWYEGEGGWTFDSLRIDECDDSGAKADLGDDSVDEYDIIPKYEAEIILDDDYAICADCKIEMDYNSIFQAASMEISSNNGKKGSCTTVNVGDGKTVCKTGQNLDGGSNVKFTFYDVLVK